MSSESELCFGSVKPVWVFLKFRRGWNFSLEMSTNCEITPNGFIRLSGHKQAHTLQNSKEARRNLLLAVVFFFFFFLKSSNTYNSNFLGLL